MQSKSTSIIPFFIALSGTLARIFASFWFRIAGTISISIVSNYFLHVCKIFLIFFFISWLKTVEIVIPELHEMRTAHLVSIGSECLCSMNPDCEDGYTLQLWTFYTSHCFLLDLDVLFLKLFPDIILIICFLPFVSRKGPRLTYDTRTNLALFRSFTAADYVAAQRLR